MLIFFFSVHLAKDKKDILSSLQEIVKVNQDLEFCLIIVEWKKKNINLETLADYLVEDGTIAIIFEDVEDWLNTVESLPKALKQIAYRVISLDKKKNYKGNSDLGVDDTVPIPCNSNGGIVSFLVSKKTKVTSSIFTNAFPHWKVSIGNSH